MSGVVLPFGAGKEGVDLPGHSEQAEQVSPVGGDGEVKDGVVKPEPFLRVLTDRSIRGKAEYAEFICASGTPSSSAERSIPSLSTLPKLMGAENGAVSEHCPGRP